MSGRTERRCFETADVVPAAHGFAVRLDGKSVRTPAGTVLVVASRRLADAIAGEWAAQDDEVRRETMPLMRLACAAIDASATQRAALVEGVVAYARTDLLCYRADEPGELAASQAAAWQPLLDWAEAAYGARLAVTAGIVPVAQPAAAVEALRRAVDAMDDLRLTALASAAAACGSLIVGLALAMGRIDAEEADRVAHVDETFQGERWGEDREAMARRRRLRADIDAAAMVLTALRQGE